jgi:Ca2+-binding EF-hand superfamily protein
LDVAKGASDAAYRDVVLSESDKKHDVHHMMHHHYKLADALNLRKQLTLYWRRDPEFMLSALQSCTLITAVLWAIVGVLLLGSSDTLDEADKTYFALLGVVLLSSSYFHIPETLELFTLILHLEQLKDATIINKVNRESRAKKTLGVLRMLGWMKTKHTKDALADATKTAQEVFPDPMVCARKRQECKEMFSLFDDDNSGSITHEEFAQLLREVAGIEDEEEIKISIKALDADGGGDVDFDEFFNWYARRQEAGSTDNEELVRLIFDVVDNDKSGFITIEEFQDAFKKLGEDVSAADIQWLVTECDEDGDNHISFEEFSALLGKYLFDV